MKIAFTNPPWWTQDKTGIRAGIRAGSRWPFTMQTNALPDKPATGEYLPFPHFLASAAAYARAHVYADVLMRDSIARRESYSIWLAWLHKEAPDVVVVESATPCWEHDKHLLKLIAQAVPGVNIIVTGTITTTHHAEIVMMGHSAVLGEYEKGVVQAATGARGKVAHQLLTVDEMNEAPFPTFDEAVALEYWDACPTGQQAPQLQVWTSRGCPFRCCFCAWPAVMTGNDPTGMGKRNVRYYGPDYVEQMINARLAINPSIRSIYLDDDTFNLSDKHTLAICAVMKRIGLPWSAMCRADTVELSTWNAMHEAGCFGVKLGMESGSQSVVTRIVNKRLNLADVEARVLPHLRDVGLKVHTTWTTGLPGETAEQAYMTWAMIQRLYDGDLHSTHQLSGTATIEGTPLDAIGRGEALDAYPDADARGFIVMGDGQAKIEQMGLLIK